MGREEEVWVVRLEMPPETMVRFQFLLQGEDGLAIDRGGGRSAHELWTVADRLDELYAFLEELPEHWGIRVLGVRRWVPEVGGRPS